MEFRDLKKQYEILKPKIDRAVSEAISGARFISGPQVNELEEKLAEYAGVKHCITCGNGTDALTLALMAWNVGAGDAVFVPDFTFFSSGECPAYAGATPIFVDVEKDTCNLDPVRLEEAILEVKAAGKYCPKVVIAVDLFGQPADYGRIKDICSKYGLLLLEDGAQGFGGAIGKKRACSFGDIATTSFFPAKPLGCYGDGGAVFTDHDEWAGLIRSYAVHGKNAEDKYDNIRIGMNSRLDTVQAAVLLVKLEAFAQYELDAVNHAAEWYENALKDTGLILPKIPEGFLSSWAQYTVQLPDEADRDMIQTKLREKDIPTMVYYRKPMHCQGAFAEISSSNPECPVTNQLCRNVFSLPIHPYLTEADLKYVTENIKLLMEG